MIETHIDRAPEIVFDRLARVEDMPQWYSAVQHIEHISGKPSGLGSRYRFRRQLPLGPAINEVEITEHQLPEAFTLQSRSGPTPFTYRYMLAPNQRGSTRLRLEGAISGEGLSGPLSLLAPLASTFFERGMRTNIEAFKRLVEAG